MRIENLVVQSNFIFIFIFLKKTSILVFMKRNWEKKKKNLNGQYITLITSPIMFEIIIMCNFT